MNPPVFISTRARSFLVVTAICLILAAFGRNFIFMGTTWTILALIVTAYNFYLCAKDSVKLRDYHVSAGRWFMSSLGVGFFTTAAFTIALSVIMFYKQSASGFYRSFDSFIVTANDMVFIDSNGATYVIGDAGISLATIVMTALVLFVCFMTATAVGTALGALHGYRGSTALTVALALGVGTCIAVVIFIAAFGIIVSAPWPGVLIFCLPALAIAWIVTATAIKQR